jgi:hypothetical protein
VIPTDIPKHSAASPDWYVWLILSVVIVGVLGFLFYYFYLLLRRGLLADVSPDEGSLSHFLCLITKFVMIDFIPCLEGRIDVMNTALPLLATDNQKILLLYARDCDKFMNLMAQFRELLSDTCKKEVRNL